MKKILFVDTPFAENAEHHERSNFIWNLLSTSFDADLLLIKTRDYLIKNLPEHKGYEQMHTLAVSNPNPIQPQEIHNFSQENLDKFSQILTTKRYEFIFFRGIACNNLILVAEKNLPGCRIFIDIDSLPSEAAMERWTRNQTWRNKRAQFDFMTLKNLEKQLLRRKHHFFMDGKGLMQRAMQSYGIPADSENFISLPNPLPLKQDFDLKQGVDDKQKTLLADKFILFYGNLASQENVDAFLYLAKDIYPRISKKLQEKDIKVYIVGDNAGKTFETYSGGRIRLIGPVQNIHAFIKSSLAVVLPFRQSPENCSRFMEAALLQKAVLTTSAGIMDLDVTTEDIGIEDTTEGYSERLVQMLSKPGDTIGMGQVLHNKITALYDRENIEQQLLHVLDNIPETPSASAHSTKLKIAIVTSNYLPETDKLSCHVHTMAQKLSDIYEVTVFCPRRTADPRQENINGIRIFRLFDLLNYTSDFPNLKTETFCPELFFRLMKDDYNLIQYYPGFDKNYWSAFSAAKLKEIPIILNIINFQNYEQIVLESGTANQDLLKNVEIGRAKKLILKNTDYLFTVTEMEYSYFRKLHQQVEHIPLPWMDCEQPVAVPFVREKAGIADDAFVFLCVGKLEFLKGQDLLLKAFIKASPSLPGAKLVFIGRKDLEPDFFEDMEGLVLREALQEDIIFTGQVEREEALAWLQEADIHVIPARFMHIGNVVIDSWANGTPVLQSDAVDPNLVIDNFNGYLFRSGDAEDLAQQMQRAYNSKSRLKELGENGKALVNDKYSFDYLLKRYTQVYKQLTL